MRILVISDIHGNREALEACLGVASGQYDTIFNLGDIVGYGASPNEVVERSRALGGVFVRGNHDKACSGISDASDFNHIAALAAHWTRKTLAPANLKWVAEMPEGPVAPDNVHDVQCVHGSPLNEDEYIIVVRDAYGPLSEARRRITFFGHTHIQGGFGTEDAQWMTLRPLYQGTKEREQFSLLLSPGAKYLINPGSVGQPRDGDWRAAFAIYDTFANIIHFHRVPYDLEGAQRKILAATLPDRLATRLREGR